ncbi:MAG: copper amine oxidase N-terminal domain-containing protein [Eubacteriales bacterium]|nr:copper amine oxidase N-terminal domain-containing protein [Eubacteriales bacterium]
MKKLLAILLVLTMLFSMSVYTVWAADEEDLEDNLTDDTINDLNKGQEGFDENAVQAEGDDHKNSEIADGDYMPTDMTLEDIKNMFGPSLNGIAPQDPIQIFIDDTFVNFPDTKPQIIDDRTLVPVRIVAEQLGATVGWDEAQQKVTITRDNLTIILTINNNTVYVNGAPQVLDVPAMVISGRTMVPFRFIFETFNMRVEWAEENRNGAVVSVIRTYSN